MLGFPGMGEGNPLPSEDPALPSDLVEAYREQMARGAETSTQRWALLSGELEGLAEGTILTVLNAVAKAVNEAAKTAQQGASGAGPGLTVAPTQNRAPSESQQPQSSPPAPERYYEGGVNPDAPAPTPRRKEETYYHPVNRYREARTAAQGATMGSVARSALAPVAKAFSGAYDPWEETTIDGEPAWVQRDENKAITQVVKASDPDAGAMFRKINRGTKIASLATGVAAGTGLVGSLGALATKVAGPIGLAIGGAQAVDNFLVGQRDKATPYRQAFGEEGTEAFAARDRLQEALAGIQGFGTIGGERAREQFQQASAMGLRGERREQATDFATDMFKRFGMDTAESMGLVEQAINSGNVSLKDFSDAITEVSRAAVEAGRSSADAIKDFAAAQQVISQNVVAGGASVGVATQVSGIADKLPKALAESLGGAKGIAGWMSQQNIQTVAMLSGQDPMAAMWQMSNPATAETAAGQFFGNIGDQIVTLMAQQMGMSPDQLRGRIKQITRGKRVSQEEQFAVFEQLAGGSDRAGGLAQQVLQLVIGLFPGVQIDFPQMLNLFFEAINGTLDPGSPIDADTAFNPLSGIKGMDGKTRRDPEGDGYRKIKGGARSGEISLDRMLKGGNLTSSSSRAFDKQRDQIMENLGYDTFGVGFGDSGVPKGAQGALDAYTDLVAKTGKGSAAIEELLKEGGQKELLQQAGVGSLDKVIFRTSGGKDRTLEQILRSGNAKDLSMVESGRAGIVNAESGDVGSVGDVTHIRIELMGEAANVLRVQQGPSEDQRNGVPASGSRWPNTYDIYGGR